ncbi:MAG: hypothetical protein NTW19_03900 [Planctomycetota bacterium]|nr:hypothetical protein [Planctomycetota bacterium]
MGQIVVAICGVTLALCGVLIAWNNFRRAHSIVIRLLEVNSSTVEQVGANNQDRFNQLVVRLMNVGMPLSSATIHVRGLTPEGWLSVQLHPIRNGSILANADEFTLEKGMVAEFRLRSFEIDEWAKATVGQLRSASSLCVTVSSNGHQADEFAIGRCAWRMRWNRIAFRLNWEFRKRLRKWGWNRIRDCDVLPLSKRAGMRFQLDLFFSAFAGQK